MWLLWPTTLTTPTPGLPLLTTEEHLPESAGSLTNKRREILPSITYSAETELTTTSETTAWSGPSPRMETSIKSRSMTHSSKTRSGIQATSPGRKVQTLASPSQLLWSPSGSLLGRLGLTTLAAGNLSGSTLQVLLPTNSLFRQEEQTHLATTSTLTRPPKSSPGSRSSLQACRELHQSRKPPFTLLKCHLLPELLPFLPLLPLSWPLLFLTCDEPSELTGPKTNN